MLIIEPTDNGQYCDTCPFVQNNIHTCRRNELNYDLCKKIDEEFCANEHELACDTHSIALNPEYNGLD